MYTGPIVTEGRERYHTSTSLFFQILVESFTHRDKLVSCALEGVGYYAGKEACTVRAPITLVKHGPEQHLIMQHVAYYW